MVETSKQVKLEIVRPESAHGNCLTFRYKVNSPPPYDSDYCLGKHWDRLTLFEETAGSRESNDDNQICLKFKFHVSYKEHGNSYKISTKTEDNAKLVQKCFFGLASGYEEVRRSFQFDLNKEYSFEDWKKGLKAEARARRSHRDAHNRNRNRTQNNPPQNNPPQNNPPQNNPPQNNPPHNSPPQNNPPQNNPPQNNPPQNNPPQNNPPQNNPPQNNAQSVETRSEPSRRNTASKRRRSSRRKG